MFVKIPNMADVK